MSPPEIDMEDAVKPETGPGRATSRDETRPRFFSLDTIRRTLDVMNPVLVREVRRLVRNNLLLAILCLYLLLLFLLTYHLVRIHPATNLETGKEVFQGIASALFLCSTLAVLVYTIGVTLRDSLDDDMLFYTYLTPFQIVVGKLSAAAALTFLFHSVALPFLMLAYLLRGVNLFALLLLLPSMFFVTQGIVTIAFSCVIGVRTIAETLASLAAFLILCPCLIPAFSILPVLNDFSPGHAVAFFVTALFFGAGAIASGTAISVHLLRTRRDLTIATRLYFTLLTYFLLGCVLCGCLGFSIVFIV